jgi:hypothetical protein
MAFAIASIELITHTVQSESEREPSHPYVRWIRVTNAKPTTHLVITANISLNASFLAVSDLSIMILSNKFKIEIKNLACQYSSTFRSLRSDYNIIANECYDQCKVTLHSLLASKNHFIQ